MGKCVQQKKYVFYEELVAKVTFGLWLKPLYKLVGLTSLVYFLFLSSSAIGGEVCGNLMRCVINHAPNKGPSQ